MKTWLKVVEVLREVSPEEVGVEEMKSNAWEFRAIEIIEEIAEVEGEKPEVGEVVEFFPEDPLLSQVAEVVEVIGEVEPNVWEVKVRREIEGKWLIEGIKPVEGQVLDTDEYRNSLWMVIKPVVGEYKEVVVRPRFFFEKPSF
jgi:hypothetical protein